MAGGFQDQDELITAINVTPLVDVVLVLLVIFMVTTEIIHELDRPQVLPIDLPAATSSEEMLSTGLMSLVIDAKGIIYLNTEKADEASLRQAIQAIKENKVVPQALISADQNVAHGSVVALMDILRLQGVRQIAFNTKRQTIE